MSGVLYKFNLDEPSSARKFPTHHHPLYSTTKHGHCAGCLEEKELPGEFYECPECDIFFHKECIAEVGPLGDKPDGIDNVQDFRHEYHLGLRQDGKVDGCEFKQILENYSKPVELDHLFECLPSYLRPSSDGEDNGEDSLENTTFTAPTIIPPMFLPLLHDLAQQMVKAGHQQQLFETYRDTRGTVLEQSLEKLGVERLSKDDVQIMKWEILKTKTENWIHYMRVSVKLLLSAEKKICDQILDGFESLRDQSFAEVTTNSFSMLISFGYAMGKCKRSADKQFIMLDMYEIMQELTPEFELIFGSKPCTEMKESALNLTKLLAQTANETLACFDELVEMYESESGQVMDGSVDLLSSYVVKYVKYLFDYESTLKQICKEIGDKDPDTELKYVVKRTIKALLNNLDGKSKQYEDEALAQLFLMNNVYYIVKYVRRSEAKDLLGDDWVQTHRRLVQQHAHKYKIVSWNKIFQCLNVDLSGSDLKENDSMITTTLVKDKFNRVSWNKILQCLNIDLSGSPLTENESMTTTLVKDKFKTFNSEFEELHQRQSQWKVPDIELCESLRLNIAEDLLPAYREFLKRFGPMIESNKNLEKYIKFTPEDLERMLNEFFEGKNLE